MNHHAKTFLLLGGRKEPVREKLIRYGLEEVRVHIGKNLSYEEEQIFTKSVAELKRRRYRGTLYRVPGKSTSNTAGVQTYQR